jgi:hypothetical protein
MSFTIIVKGDLNVEYDKKLPKIVEICIKMFWLGFLSHFLIQHVNVKSFFVSFIHECEIDLFTQFPILL